jgi:hypothetical protein
MDMYAGSPGFHGLCADLQLHHGEASGREAQELGIKMDTGECFWTVGFGLADGISGIPGAVNC